jgi:hypothetical protein
MAEYRITKVSQQPPREWSNPKGGTIYYIKVKLQGHDKPVEIGKKSPDSLHAGVVVHGTIEPTEFPADKFKADLLPQPGYGGGGNRQPKDEAAIRAQMSIKAAIQALPQADVTGDNSRYLAAVEELATAIFSMVDRVKNSGSVNTVFKEW